MPSRYAGAMWGVFELSVCISQYPHECWDPGFPCTCTVARRLVLSVSGFNAEADLGHAGPAPVC